MPTTAWILSQDVTGTGWSPVVAATLEEAVDNDNDGEYATHANPATDKLKCLDWDFAGAGIIATDIIDGIEVECWGTTGNPFVVPGSTIGVRLTLDGSSGVGNEKEFSSDGPGNLQGMLGGASDVWGAGPLTGADILTANFGVLIAQGATSAGTPTYGRQVDYVSMRIYYSAGTVTPSVLLSSKHRRIPDIGAIRNKGLGEKVQ